MTDLVDPLAALFGGTLTNPRRLRLARTVVSLRVRPPLALVTITRSFTNDTRDVIEGVLAVPGDAVDVVYALAVTIDGVRHDAQATPAGRARDEHERAIEDAKVSILLERLDAKTLLAIIAPLAPGAMVDVAIACAVPLALVDGAHADTWSLDLALSVVPPRGRGRLGGFEDMIVESYAHSASVVIEPGSTGIVHLANGRKLSSGQTAAIDGDGIFSARIVGEQSASAGASRLHVRGPDGQILEVAATDLTHIAPRADNAATRQGMIRVRPFVGDGQSIVPAEDAGIRAYALTAWARTTGVPAEAQRLRAAAGALDAATSLAFIGPDGRDVGATPQTVKVALPAPGRTASGRSATSAQSRPGRRAGRAGWPGLAGIGAVVMVMGVAGGVLLDNGTMTTAPMPIVPAPPPPGPVAAAPPPGSQGMVFPDSSTKLLAATEVAALGATRLRTARDEIYAREGLRFQDAALREQFSRLPWYRPSTDRVTLNAIEQTNVDMLERAAKRARQD